MYNSTKVCVFTELHQLCKCEAINIRSCIHMCSVLYKIHTFIFKISKLKCHDTCTVQINYIYTSILFLTTIFYYEPVSFYLGWKCPAG